MKILVTGANGFVGKNLIAELENKGYKDIFKYGRDSGLSLLEEYTRECDFIFHLAGVNRPKDEKEYMAGNYELLSQLIDLLKRHNNTSPILLSSSTQAVIDNPYGFSKRAAEDLLFSYGEDTGAQVYIYRLPNIFGKWCKPNYNSVVATFCYNISRNLDIRVDDPKTELTLSYIDDVIKEFLRALEGKATNNKGYCHVPVTYNMKLGELKEKLYSFSNLRESLIMPSLESDLDKALFSTFISYLEENDFSYELEKRTDERGWLAEFIKSKSFGQIFISKTKPGITRGNHWHHSKVEKFLVMKGEAVIRLRKIDSNEVLFYRVNGDNPQVVDIPVGYTHSITNCGNEDVITLFWANEIFNSEIPDTYFLEV